MVALGVDFGTSHTVAVARWPDGRARPLLFDGTPLLPSATFWDDGELVVGRDAVHGARRAPAFFEPHPKRRIDDGHVLLGAREVPVHDLLVAVFQRVRAEFTRTAGGPPSAVTVTHPATWASTRRKALAAAVRAADLPAATLVPEPVAAATYFVRVLHHLVPVGSAVVVYDLGAGTFDGSVVARTADGFEVLAVDGRDDLGGLDFDEVVLTMLGRHLPAGQWRRLLAPTTIEEARAARVLREEAREAKERLSRAASATVLVPLLDVDVPLTREEFDAAARPLVERSVRVLTEAVRLSRVTPDRIAGIFLVGGASQIPLVATELHRAFGRPPVTIEQPELVVAEGSVLVGARLDRPGAAMGGGAADRAASGDAAGAHPTPVEPVSGGAVPSQTGHPPAVRPGTAPGLPVLAPRSPAPQPSTPPGPPAGGQAAAAQAPVSPGAMPFSPAAGGAPFGPAGSGAPFSPATGGASFGPAAGGAPFTPAAGGAPFSPAAGGVPARGMPLQPGQRMPYPPRPVYYQPPPQQIVYVPQYVLPPVPPPPRRLAPGTIRWPAGFLTLLAVLLFLLTGLFVLALILDAATTSSVALTPTASAATRYAALACGAGGVLYLHGARRLRRGGNGHLWYPIGLCLLQAAGGTYAAVSDGSAAWLCMTAVYLGSAALLLLPGARAWVRPWPGPSGAGDD